MTHEGAGGQSRSDGAIRGRPWWLLPALALLGCGHDWSAADAGDGLGDARDGSGDGGPDIATDGDGETAADTEGGSEVDTGTDTGPGTCGNGAIEGSEECDDGNGVDGDGCETDCTYSCHSYADCPDDGNPCTTETCATVPGGRLCEARHNEDPCSDGDPCTTGDVCAGGDCVPGARLPTWYLDEDGDTYGRDDETACGEDTPAGYVDTPGDCCDSNEGVHPGVTTWTSTPYACEGSSTSSLDWDCSGAEELRWPSCAECAEVGLGRCEGSGVGWVMTGAPGACEPPACGETGWWATDCRYDEMRETCTLRGTGARVQQCR